MAYHVLFYSNKIIALLGENKMIVSLYQKKASARKDSVPDWQEIERKIPGAKLTRLGKTNCDMELAEGFTVEKLDAFLKKEYPSILRHVTPGSLHDRRRSRGEREGGPVFGGVFRSRL